MTTINLHAAKTRLSRLVDDAAAGAEIIIARAGKPMAKLVPLTRWEARPTRKLGCLAGQARVPVNFDVALTEDVLDAFEGY